VFADGPPRPPAADDGGWPVVSAARREFPADAVLSPEHRAALGIYLADLLRPHGDITLDAIGDGGQSYGEMAADLIGTTVAADQPVDTLVLAFAVPDVRPGRATATYLSHVCPGQPLAFAVCDQGAAAGFTALRLARAYTATGGQALLLVVEQAGLPYRVTPSVVVPTAHAGVALLCGAAGPARLGTPRQHPDVPADLVAEVLAADLAAAGTGPDTTVIVGPGLAAAGVPVPTTGAARRVAVPGRPYTGVWWELAGLLADPPPDRSRAILAEYDPVLRYLCTLTARFG
jgi:4-hydroxymandelate oxidase